jgi:hypothetical protein
MNPVFYQGDELFFEEHPATLRKGDIILYDHPHTGQQIIHRIFSISGNTIQTAGDNNSHFDPYLLSHEQVKGRIIGLVRKGRYHQVKNGFFGLIQYYIHQLFRIMLLKGYRIVSPFYLYIARRYLFCRITEPILSPELVVVKTNQMILLQLYVGDRLIGMKQEKWDDWSIYPPWRLFIDDRDLPTDNAKVLYQAENPESS